MAGGVTGEDDADFTVFATYADHAGWQTVRD
jgi:hypothetical protein